jgi:hypothetical protein
MQANGKGISLYAEAVDDDDELEEGEVRGAPLQQQPAGSDRGSSAATAAADADLAERRAALEALAMFATAAAEALVRLRGGC